MTVVGVQFLLGLMHKGDASFLVGHLLLACVMSPLWTLWRVRCLWAFPLGVDASLVYPLIGLLHVLSAATRRVACLDCFALLRDVLCSSFMTYHF